MAFNVLYFQFYHSSSLVTVLAKHNKKSIVGLTFLMPHGALCYERVTHRNAWPGSLLMVPVSLPAILPGPAEHDAPATLTLTRAVRSFAGYQSSIETGMNKVFAHEP